MQTDLLINAKRLYAAIFFGIAVVSCMNGCRWASVGQNTLGVRMYQEGKYQEALQQFQVARNSDPTNPDTYYNLASTYHKLGTMQKDKNLLSQAESLYHQCLDGAPNHVEAHRGLAVLLVESGQPDSGFTLLKKWAANNPQLADARVELSRLHFEFGEQKVAEKYLDEALAINPSSYQAWTARGKLREASGDYAQALQNYQRSLSINSLQPELYQQIASLNVRLAQNAITPTVGGAVPTTNPATGNRNRY